MSVFLNGIGYRKTGFLERED